MAFLKINGVAVLDPERRLYDAMISVANKEMDEYDLADLLSKLPTE